MEMYLVVLLLFLRNSSYHANGDQLDEKIVGGSPCQIEDYPFLVQVIGPGSLCGGSLLSFDWVLTAAHCVLDGEGALLENITIVAGTSTSYYTHIETYNTNYISRVAEEVIAHPNFDLAAIKDFLYDIAVIRVNSSFPQDSPRIAVAALPTSSQFVNDAKGVLGMGWGHREPMQSQEDDDDAEEEDDLVSPTLQE